VHGVIGLWLAAGLVVLGAKIRDAGWCR
jgi:hypothetical protein